MIIGQGVQGARGAEPGGVVDTVRACGRLAPSRIRPIGACSSWRGRTVLSSWPCRNAAGRVWPAGMRAHPGHGVPTLDEDLLDS